MPDHGADERELLADAARVVINAQYATPALLGKRCRVRPGLAEHLLARLEQAHIVGSAQSGRAREVLVPLRDRDRALAALQEGANAGD